MLNKKKEEEVSYSLSMPCQAINSFKGVVVINEANESFGFVKDI